MKLKLKRQPAVAAEVDIPQSRRLSLEGIFVLQRFRMRHPVDGIWTLEHPST